MSNTFVPWWGDKEVVTEYVAPGIRYIRDNSLRCKYKDIY